MTGDSSGMALNNTPINSVTAPSSGVEVSVPVSQILARETVSTTGNASVYTAPDNGFAVISEIWFSDQNTPGSSAMDIHLVEPAASPALAVANRLVSGVASDDGPYKTRIAMNPRWTLGFKSSVGPVTITVMGTEILR